MLPSSNFYNALHIPCNTTSVLNMEYHYLVQAISKMFAIDRNDISMSTTTKILLKVKIVFGRYITKYTHVKHPNGYRTAG